MSAAPPGTGAGRFAAAALAGPRRRLAAAVLACAASALLAPFAMLPLVAGAACPPGRRRAALVLGAGAAAAAWCAASMPVDLSALPDDLADGQGDQAFLARHLLALHVLVPLSVALVAWGGILLRQAWGAGDPREAVVRTALAVMLVTGSGSAIEAVGTRRDVREARSEGRSAATMDAYVQIGEMRSAFPGLDVAREQRILVERSLRRGLGLPPMPEPLGGGRFGEGI